MAQPGKGGHGMKHGGRAKTTSSISSQYDVGRNRRGTTHTNKYKDVGSLTEGKLDQSGFTAESGKKE